MQTIFSFLADYLIFDNLFPNSSKINFFSREGIFLRREKLIKKIFAPDYLFRRS